MSEKIYGQFDLETIEKLADIVKNKDLGEITIADGDKVITVKGKKCPPPATSHHAPSLLDWQSVCGTWPSTL
jgi:hypothetical protein